MVPMAPLKSDASWLDCETKQKEKFAILHKVNAKSHFLSLLFLTFVYLFLIQFYL